MLTILFIALAVCAISWTVTQEELFKEFQQHCIRHKKTGHAAKRKFFYLFTCHYCFSHYVTAALLFLTGYRMVHNDWRGSVIAFFAIVWVANWLMSGYALLRQFLKHKMLAAQLIEKELERQREMENESRQRQRSYHVY